MTDRVSQAVAAYFEALDAEPDNGPGFVELFSEDARFEDPIGGPVMQGREGIAKFHKGLTRAWSRLHLEPTVVHVRGNRAAVSWKAEGHSATGKDIRFEGINVVHVDEAGRISALEGYWDLEGVIAQM